MTVCIVTASGVINMKQQMNIQSKLLSKTLAAFVMAAAFLLTSCSPGDAIDAVDDAMDVISIIDDASNINDLTLDLEDIFNQPLQVADVDPSDESVVDSFPTSITLTFDADNVFLASITVDQFELVASGGDGTFGDENDTTIVITNAILNNVTVTLDLTAAAATAVADEYRFTAIGNGADAISDFTGNPLDGDGDELPGGNFISTFTFEPAPAATATLNQVQE